MYVGKTDRDDIDKCHPGKKKKGDDDLMKHPFS